MAKLRRRKAWSQVKLGAKCQPTFTADYISKIERGKRAADSRSTIETFALALQVPVAVLAGELPSLHSDHWRRDLARHYGYRVVGIDKDLRGLEGKAPPDDLTPETVDELISHSRFNQLGHLLLRAGADAHAAAVNLGPRYAQVALGMVAEAHACIAYSMPQLGEKALAWQVVDRAARISEAVGGDPTLSTDVLWNLSQGFLATESFAEAVHTARVGIANLDESPATRFDEWYAMLLRPRLWLDVAMGARRLGNLGEASDALSRAEKFVRWPAPPDERLRAQHWFIAIRSAIEAANAEESWRRLLSGRDDAEIWKEVENDPCLAVEVAHIFELDGDDENLVLELRCINTDRLRFDWRFREILGRTLGKGFDAAHHELAQMAERLDLRMTSPAGRQQGRTKSPSRRPNLHIQ